MHCSATRCVSLWAKRSSPAHPSVHRSIRWYGGELADFLARSPPYEEQPILAEVALLEWTLAEVFERADAGPVARGDYPLLIPAWAALGFEFHPSLRRLELCWNTGRCLEGA